MVGQRRGDGGERINPVDDEDSQGGGGRVVVVKVFKDAGGDRHRRIRSRGDLELQVAAVRQGDRVNARCRRGDEGVSVIAQAAADIVAQRGDAGDAGRDGQVAPCRVVEERGVDIDGDGGGDRIERVGGGDDDIKRVGDLLRRGDKG